MTAEPPIPEPRSPGPAPMQRRDQPWQVERIDTVPMSADEYDNAVHALAALIGAWRHATSGDSAEPGSAERGVE